MRRAVVFTLTLGALVVAGCPKVDLKSILEEADPYLPKVQFQKIEVKDIDWEGADTDFVFRVENPNPVGVRLSSFSWDLAFEGTDALDGASSEGLELPASGSALVRIPVDLVYAQLYELVQATRGEDEIDFALSGHFGFDTPAGEVKVPFTEKGDFPAPRKPKVQLGKVRVGKLNLLQNRATVELDLKVTNEHASALAFKNFDYDLAFGGTEVASGTVPTLGSTAGGKTSTLTLPVDVNLLNAGTVVVEALTGKTRLKTGLDASVEVGTPFGAIPLRIDESGRIEVE